MSNIPLAERMRPKSLAEYVGQKHLVGQGTTLRKIIDAGMIPSMILWGPPGTGKTTLARLIAQNCKRPFYQLSAIASGVKDIREVIDSASKQQFFGTANPVLFIDEIHRFSKSQQDSLLGAVEQGIVTLIGATTENPSFEVIPALLSRMQVYILQSLQEEELKQILTDALLKDEELSRKKVAISEFEAFYRLSGGDARKLLNALELVVNAAGETEMTIDNELVMKCIQQNLALYDKGGEQHYDVISAFIKSVRGSDPNAAVYWLARMIEGGEDPLFIARRLLILAAEDIGNANPTGLVIANSCYEAVHKIGFPEARIVLAQTVTYLASSSKSNAAYQSINKAQELVKQTGNLPVPVHLRNAPTKLMKEIGYGADYQYAHDFSGNFVDQEYMPEKLSGTVLYNPGNNPRENELRAYLRGKWEKKYRY